MRSKRSDIDPMPEYFDRYINLVEDVDAARSLRPEHRRDRLARSGPARSIGTTVYEPGKWTVAGMIQHIADFERILSYRALVYARNAGIIPQSIDENLVAENANANHRGIREVVADLRAARVATREMFASFDQEMLDTIGL